MPLFVGWKTVADGPLDLHIAVIVGTEQGQETACLVTGIRRRFVPATTEDVAIAKVLCSSHMNG